LSEYFVREFEFDRENFDVFGSEAARCEAVIYPILREACKSFIDNYSLWSHKSITADAILTGVGVNVWQICNHVVSSLRGTT
jgi:hypothetical protein